MNDEERLAAHLRELESDPTFQEQMRQLEHEVATGVRRPSMDARDFRRVYGALELARSTLAEDPNVLKVALAHGVEGDRLVSHLVITCRTVTPDLPVASLCNIGGVAVVVEENA